MEKQYFKYRFGYINIDDENLYLNETGNWSYIEKLKEKEKASPPQKPITTIIYKSIFLLSSIVILLSIIFYNMSFINVAIIFLSHSAIYYFVFKYLNLKTDFNYKIPLSKINSITQKGNILEINFRLKDNVQNQKFILDKIDPKGFEVLTQMNLLKS